MRKKSAQNCPSYLPPSPLLKQMSEGQEHRKRIENKVAVGRFATVEELSSTCLHLIDNGYINGQMIVVDGGYAY